MFGILIELEIVTGKSTNRCLVNGNIDEEVGHI